MNHALKTYNHKSLNNIYGISPVRSDGSPAAKIEAGSKVNFCQILMSALM